MSSTSKNCKAKQLQSLTDGRVHRENLHEKGKEIDTDDNVFDLPYIPTPILFDILSRLEIKPLFNCRLVCKRWAFIISTSEFSQLHLIRSSPTNCLIQRYNIYYGNQANVLHMLDPEYPNSLENKLLFKPMINFPNVPMSLRNSCNGLVCLVQKRFGVYNIYVCNPILREYLTLTNPPVNTEFCNGCLFGFSQKTNQYKVLVSGHKSHNVIYTCGEGSWKNIGSSPCRVWNNSYNAFVNGYLHWMSYPFIICCFDFDSEQFRVVPKPDDFHPHEREHYHQTRIAVLNGNLSVFSSKSPGYGGLVIWVMKNYGDKESWCKDFVIDCNFDYFNNGLMKLEPIMIKGNVEILMIYKNEFIILYDTISKTFRSKQQIVGEDIDFHAIAYTPSLISLKEVAKGENIKVVGRN